MPMYAFNNRASQPSLTSTLKTLLIIRTSSLANVTGRLWNYSVGADGAPSASDSEIDYDLSSFSASGNATGTTTDTLNKLDPSDRASDFLVHLNPTISQGAVYTVVLSCSLNQRQSWTWQAYRADQTILVPTQFDATGPGLAFRAKSTNYTDKVAVTGLFEQTS